jgi:SNF2 family DNA or RNA helicase
VKPWTAHKYQREAVKFGVSRATAAFLLDPGLGKTAIELMVFKILKAKGIAEKMLVVAPLRPCYSVWPEEIKKWEEFKDLTCVVLHGPEKAARLREDVDIYIINPEGLEWLSKQGVDPWFDVLVVDESTRFKHANTKRFKLLRPMLPRFKRRYILTGSPAPNGLMDLFGQIYILDLGSTLGRYITHFRLQYFNPTGYGGYTWVPRRGAEEQIYARLRPLALRMSAEDYLELPELIYNTVTVDLPPPAMKLYKEMETSLIAAVKDGTVIAANAAAATGKCRQIANGGIYHEGGEKWTDIHEAKLDAVEEIVEELQGKPALIAYEYQHDLSRLLQRFGKDTPHIGGGVGGTRFREIEAAWNAGDIPVLLAQPQSVAHGLNLQGTGAAVIWHSLTWNLEDYEQFIRRVWRQGQKERVIVHHVIAKGTIDELIVKMLNAKDKTQRALLGALREHFA